MKVTEIPPSFKHAPSNPVGGDFWLSGEGSNLLTWAIQALRAGRTQAALVLALKERFGPLATEAVELAAGAVKSEEIEGLPQLRLIHRESLEQSSKPPFNHFHAQLFAGCKTILEVGTGLGLDTIALAQVAERVISLEPNVERANYAIANFKSLGISNIEVRASTLEDCYKDLPPFDGLFADPSRRVGGERLRDPNACMPSMDLLAEVGAGKIVRVKLSPTAAGFPLPAGWTRIFVGSLSEARELIAASRVGVNEAETEQMIILDNHSQEKLSLINSQLHSLPIEQAKYLYEPHPIVFSAPLGIQTICKQFGLSLLTTEHGYLVSAALSAISHWARRFEIIESVGFKQDKIQALINKYALPKSTAIKKREHKISPDQLHRSLNWVTLANSESKQDNAQLFSFVCIDSGTKQWCCLVRNL